MNQLGFRVFLLLCYCCLPTGCLECYACSGIADSTKCNTTQTCAQNESCFMDRVLSTNGTLLTFGCLPNQQCYNHTSIGSIIGRRDITRRQDQRCTECCSTDRCGIQLCSHLAPTLCIDDESLDCARLSTLFNVCADIKHAKSVCPRFCGLCNVVDGKWSSWLTWSECSVTCDNGTQVRTRTCTAPSPANGGDNCQGNVSETKPCVRELCPVHGGWTEWFQWGTCSVSCDAGIQRRNRNCTNPAPSRFGDHCFGDSIDDRLCLPAACFDGAWSNWNEWSNCSLDFCGGIKTRSRTCSNPYPSPYGKYCQGNPMQVDSCSCPSNCMDIKRATNSSRSGLYYITLWKSKTTIVVYCDMDTDGGGWTVFQRRFNGSISFDRTFLEYENGFGQNDGEFWLGLKTIQEMTSRGKHELRIDLTAADGTQAYELFQTFSLSPRRKYTLHIDRGTGTAGDDGTGLHYNSGYDFYTRDSDNRYGCAASLHAGWWFDSCTFVNLNGEYITPGTQGQYVTNGYAGTYYNAFKQIHSLKSTSMMFKPS